jgi:hypothetical protein
MADFRDWARRRVAGAADAAAPRTEPLHALARASMALDLDDARSVAAMQRRALWRVPGWVMFWAGPIVVAGGAVVAALLKDVLYLMFAAGALALWTGFRWLVARARPRPEAIVEQTAARRAEAVLTEEGVAVIAPQWSEFRRWAAIDWVREGRRLIVLEDTSPSWACTVPKRAIADLREFRRIIAEHR